MLYVMEKKGCQAYLEFGNGMYIYLYNFRCIKENRWTYRFVSPFSLGSRTGKDLYRVEVTGLYHALHAQLPPLCEISQYLGSQVPHFEDITLMLDILCTAIIYRADCL